MTLISIGEAANRLDRKYHWVHRWVKTRGLGKKVGWGIVLTEDDLRVLKECGKRESTQNGSQTAA